ncbi:MAG TPA: arylamine N-acetyltransferase [Pyrinomonadaceae bacterium]|jgi:N-hydroxyarylamine O-acetyltransferase
MADNEVMNVGKYLARIGLDRTGVVPDIAGLKLLQRQHLLNVPFENLDIHWRRPIMLDTNAFYRKIVEENRGGFCYELNGLFNELLRESGFETRLLSARVVDEGDVLSPDYDHAAIMVMIGEMQYIADVGFGAFSAEPLLLVPDREQEVGATTYLVRPYDGESFEIAKRNDAGWRGEYVFMPLGHDLSEFEERCLWHQTSPDSHFMKNKVCSQMTMTGRKTLTDTKFIVTTETDRVESDVSSAAEFDRLLSLEFGINRPVSISSFSLVEEYVQ